MRRQNSLVEVLFAQEADKELCRVGVATKLCGVCAEAITIVGVCRRCELACTCTLASGLQIIGLFGHQVDVPDVTKDVTRQ